MFTIRLLFITSSISYKKGYLNDNILYSQQTPLYLSVHRHQSIFLSSDKTCYTTLRRNLRRNTGTLYNACGHLPDMIDCNPTMTNRGLKHKDAEIIIGKRCL